jgi:hypothetical protein
MSQPGAQMALKQNLPVPQLAPLGITDDQANVLVAGTHP